MITAVICIILSVGAVLLVDNILETRDLREQERFIINKLNRESAENAAKRKLVKKVVKKAVKKHKGFKVKK